MNNLFQYSTLNYRPSQILGEQVVIGLLMVFHGEKVVKFFWPRHLARITACFPSSDLTILRKYLKSFELKAKHLEAFDIGRINGDLWIDQNFFTKDSNSLSFNSFKQGFYDKPEEIITHFKLSFFKNYEPEQARKKIDDTYLIQEFNDSLKLFSPERQALIKRSYQLKTELVETVFDFGWRNGTTNLVKSLSFDLKKKDSIQNKAVRWYGEIAQFNEKAKRENIRFDFLVHTPQDKNLFDAYDRALKIIDGLEAKTSIIEQNKLGAYVEKAVETAVEMEV